jgi:NAD(P)-dependent dehydrogenase (short-subunit alcohol dehydrogenase family)
MPLHPSLGPGRVAVVTGAASGIGFAAAAKFAGLGMKVVMADANAEALEAAEDRVARLTAHPGDVRLCVVDVSEAADVERLRDLTLADFGEIALLMNNAGVDGGGGVLGDLEKWRRVIDVNLWGIIHGVNLFAPEMIRQRAASAIVNTGSKQGITCPPGDAAYNVSKAGVKVVTEALAHELRNIEGCKVSAHLLIPGFTFTGLTGAAAKPAGAWTAEQVVDFMIDSMAAGDFYILCPDNEVTRATDERRILWAAGDIVDNRPPLSRWHPNYKDAFAEFAKGASVGGGR